MAESSSPIHQAAAFALQKKRADVTTWDGWCLS